jgi:N-acyl-D-amino-acid deacylase
VAPAPLGKNEERLVILRALRVFLGVALAPAAALAQSPLSYDLVIANGTIYDGTGAAPIRADVGIRGDRIAAVGDLSGASTKQTIDAKGLAVAPGFINMLSHAEVTLLVDPRSMSDILQGVTLEVLGESSMGPWNEEMKRASKAGQGDLKYDIAWTTLGEYLDHLEKKGITPNVASLVSASTVRIHEVGRNDRPPTADELERMKQLVAQAMEEGAMGLTTALIYAPATYAKTDELVELSKVAASYGGIYIAHIRSEANKFMEAIDETLQIAREASLPVEIYHLKAGGKQNWAKMDQAIAKIEQAQREGVHITADMYAYIAGQTGLDASMPPWVQEGGYDEWAERLKDPAIRERVRQEMNSDAQDWENLFYSAGTPEGIVLVGFKNPDLKKYNGMTLGQVAKLRGTTPADTAMDLVIEDGTRVGTVYFMMSEDNVRKQIALPWVSFGSDAGSNAAEGDFLKSSTHPRAYGNFARVLGKYVREEKVISLEEAVRKLTLLPATNLKIGDRGRLAPGYFADVAVFDPKTIADHATFEQPHQYATGMVHVIVNGVRVVEDGKHTGATPGRVVRGPGWTGRASGEGRTATPR